MLKSTLSNPFQYNYIFDARRPMCVVLYPTKVSGSMVDADLVKLKLECDTPSWLEGSYADEEEDADADEGEDADEEEGAGDLIPRTGCKPTHFNLRLIYRTDSISRVVFHDRDLDKQDRHSDGAGIEIVQTREREWK
ncbi:hypothetical protein BHYA_0080g00020 [Botrytis hyacinthi]|uniref:Uncharacterized protein n=1 Tax=Botrytis hyacinthi TaxID=278943 RepID=A0A4Z1GMK1_9HELO|nr:hypothetical protein BHYA_0080g00020 [Botrytis hyacinthi]